MLLIVLQLFVSLGPKTNIVNVFKESILLSKFVLLLDMLLKHLNMYGCVEAVYGPPKIRSIAT